MSTPAVVLIGGPDSGKTNFVARLWIALRQGHGALRTSGSPDQIKYVEDAVAFLHQGSFAPRTDKNLEVSQGSTVIPLGAEHQAEAAIAELVIPDISGEVWKNAVETSELPADAMAQLDSAVGALVFVRVLSPLNVSPIDWVNSAQLMRMYSDDADATAIPTQVELCEFLRFAESTMRRRTGRCPRISVIITAWDLLDAERSSAGPTAYLQRQYPLFAGRLADMDDFEIAIFGVSVFGGDPETDEQFRSHLLNSDPGSAGYVRFDRDGGVEQSGDLTLPVAWAVGAVRAL